MYCYSEMELLAPFDRKALSESTCRFYRPTRNKHLLRIRRRQWCIKKKKTIITTNKNNAHTHRITKLYLSSLHRNSITKTRSFN